MPVFACILSTHHVNTYSMSDTSLSGSSYSLVKLDTRESPKLCHQWGNWRWTKAWGYSHHSQHRGVSIDSLTHGEQPTISYGRGPNFGARWDPKDGGVHRGRDSPKYREIWCSSWKIPAINGWYLGVPHDLGNLQISPFIHPNTIDFYHLKISWMRLKLMASRGSSSNHPWGTQ